MADAYEFSKEEQTLFRQMEEVKGEMFELCRRMRRMALRKTPRNPEKDMVFELLPNSSDLYEIVDSYKSRYIAANIILEELARKQAAPSLKLVQRKPGN